MTNTDPRRVGDTVSDRRRGNDIRPNSGACTTPFPCAGAALSPSLFFTIKQHVHRQSRGDGSITTTRRRSLQRPSIAPRQTTVPATPQRSCRGGHAVAKSGTASVARGRTAYAVVVSKRGPWMPRASCDRSDASGLTFVSNSGGCAGPYPCALATIPAGSKRNDHHHVQRSDLVRRRIDSTHGVRNVSTADPIPANNSGRANTT